MSLIDYRATLDDAARCAKASGVGVEHLPASQPWLADARLTRRGRAVRVLACADRLEARFENINRSAMVADDFTDKAHLREGLDKLLRLSLSYLEGHDRISRARSVLRVRSALVIPTSDGDWRIGKRITPPTTRIAPGIDLQMVDSPKPRKFF